MLYVGLDIHDKGIAICVLGEAGIQVASRAPTCRIASPRYGMGATAYSHGAPPRRMPPKGCLASPAIVSLRS
jgi:hypothetical protein